MPATQRYAWLGLAWPGLASTGVPGRVAVESRRPLAMNQSMAWSRSGAIFQGKCQQKPKQTFFGKNVSFDFFAFLEVFAGSGWCPASCLMPLTFIIHLWQPLPFEGNCPSYLWVFLHHAHQSPGCLLKVTVLHICGHPCFASLEESKSALTTRVSEIIFPGPKK